MVFGPALWHSNNPSQGITLLVWFTAPVSAIEELERLQAAREAREESASSPDDEATAPCTRANEEQLEEQGAKNTLADSSALAEPEDALRKDEAA